MSVVIEPGDIAEAAAGRGAPFVITADAGRAAKVSHDSVELDGDEAVFTAGRGTRANVQAGSVVTLLWPGAEGEMAIIADGQGSLDGDRVRVRITSAVRHRLP